MEHYTALILSCQVDEEECSAQERRPVGAVQCSQQDCDTWEVSKDL